jgi:hypothetical protein
MPHRVRDKPIPPFWPFTPIIGYRDNNLTNRVVNTIMLTGGS